MTSGPGMRVNPWTREVLPGVSGQSGQDRERRFKKES